MKGDVTMTSPELRRSRRITIIMLAITIPIILYIPLIGLYYYLEEDWKRIPIFTWKETPSEGLSEIVWDRGFNAPPRMKITWESNYVITVSLTLIHYQNNHLEPILWMATGKAHTEIWRIDDELVMSETIPGVYWGFPQGSDERNITFELTIIGYTYR